jgi:thioesterase domain-containing protein
MSTPSAPADPASARLIVRLAESEAGGIPYFLFPGAGGHVFPFQPFARLLADRRTGLGLVDPTLLDDESLPSSVEDYAKRMVEDVRIMAPTGPYLLAGYSTGGLVAFEVARLLRASAQSVGLLLIDSVLPGGLRKKPLVRRFLMRATDPDARGYPLSVFMPFLATRYRRLRGSLQAGLQERPRVLSQRLVYAKARARAARSRYRPCPCRIPAILIRATQVSPRFEPPDDYGWGRYVQLLSVIDVGAEHGEIYKGANIRPLADAASEAMDQLEQALSSKHRTGGRCLTGRLITS